MEEEVDMKISIELMDSILARFALLFQMHPEARDASGILPDLWCDVLRDFNAHEIATAARKLELILDRFPVPSDFVRQIEAMRQSMEDASQ